MMDASQSQTPAVKLSICITTLNRASFIGETLESILAQATQACEVVVLDAASTDGTERVVSEYAQRFGCVRYVRQQKNNGLDEDYNRVVELARGEYCWLMTDDDLMKPGAVTAVLDALRRNCSLVLVNVDSRDVDMSSTVALHGRWLDFASDRVYGPHEMDRLFLEVNHVLKYIASFIVKREIWLSRERDRHYGSLFNYLHVIFQKPLPSETVVLAEPAISYRWGNGHAWSSKVFETRMVRLPALVWSLDISERAKSKICSAAPWKSPAELLYCRALGLYSITEYRRLIRPRLKSIREALTPALVALAPGALVNALFMFYYSVSRRRYRGIWEPAVVLTFMRQSPFYLGNWRVFKRAR